MTAARCCNALLLSALVGLSKSTPLADNHAVVTPRRLSYKALMEHNEPEAALLDALDTVGLLSITDLPNNFATIKRDVLTSLETNCFAANEGATTVLEDNTVRRTIAAKVTEELPSCLEPQEAFRAQVSEVTQRIGHVLAQALGIEQAPLLFSSQDDDKEYTLQDIFEQGSHLEHFHGYYAAESSQVAEEPPTIDWHVDQGLMLVFTPGVIDGKPSGGFWIQTKSGEKKEVQFSEQDELVILLGHGVEQYVNPASAKSLKALPHAVTLSSARGSTPRLWYGRMVLPPADAIYPTDENEKNLEVATYGDIAQNWKSGLGCSSPTSSSSLTIRQLNNVEEKDCVANEGFCWHRCMNYTEFDASPDLCSGRNLEYGCVRTDGVEWDGTHDNTFAIRCVSEIKENTENPSGASSTVGNKMMILGTVGMIMVGVMM